MYTKLLVCTLVSLIIDSVFAPPPGLYDGQTWNPAPGCPQGGVYMINNKSIRCHCWGFQGYICEPNFPSGRGGGGGFGGTGGGNGCPPGTSVCVINDNTNTNSNTNTNQNRNQNQNRNGNRNGNKNGNGNGADYGSDYANYDG